MTCRPIPTKDGLIAWLTTLFTCAPLSVGFRPGNNARTIPEASLIPGKRPHLMAWICIASRKAGAPWLALIVRATAFFVVVPKRDSIRTCWAFLDSDLGCCPREDFFSSSHINHQNQVRAFDRECPRCPSLRLTAYLRVLLFRYSLEPTSFLSPKTF